MPVVYLVSSAAIIRSTLTPDDFPHLANWRASMHCTELPSMV